MKHRLFLVLFCLFAIPQRVRAHDLWLVPKRSPIEAKHTAELLAVSGMDFPKSENSMAVDRVAFWVQRGPGGDGNEVWQSREEEKARCFFRVLESEGTQWVGLATKPRTLAQRAAEFNEYLAHDGLPHVLDARKARGTLERDEVEQYSKYAKAIVQVGQQVDDRAPQALGLSLEIVPEKNPLLLREGEDCAVRVIFEGKPLDGFLLQAGWENMGETKKIEARTDHEGRAKLRLPSRGASYLRGIHMTEVEGKPYRYESFWTSLTIRRP